jgi:glutathione S-transferase
MSTDKEIVISYFPIRGRAEPIRLLLEDMGVPYRNEPVDIKQWRKIKAETPFGKVPLYHEGQLEIAESHAIMRHLARRYDLYGNDELEGTRCDVVQEVLHDAVEQFAELMWNPDFAQVRDDFIQKRLRPMLTNLQQYLQDADGSPVHWVGRGNTFVDYIGYVWLDMVRALAKEVLQEFPRLWNLYQEFEKRPRIRAYLESDRRYPTITLAMAYFGNTPETS